MPGGDSEADGDTKQGRDEQEKTRYFKKYNIKKRLLKEVIYMDVCVRERG